jgi:hypothetical protein
MRSTLKPLENISDKPSYFTSVNNTTLSSTEKNNLTPSNLRLKQLLNTSSPLVNMKAEEHTLYSLIANAPHSLVPYSIYDYSSHSGSYFPQNIAVNNPSEQASRWSSGSHDQSQFITIKLEQPVVACKEFSLTKKNVFLLYDLITIL